MASLARERHSGLLPDAGGPSDLPVAVRVRRELRDLEHALLCEYSDRFPPGLVLSVLHRTGRATLRDRSVPLEAVPAACASRARALLEDRSREAPAAGVGR